MDFYQLLSLLERNSLRFARAQSFPDNLEGAIGIQELLESAGDIAPETAEWLTERMRHYVYISCWHMNENESMPMWEIYSGRGVAVKSSLHDLISALDSTEYVVHIGEVEYDLEEGPLDIFEQEDGSVRGVFFEPYAHKSEYYSYENELRAMTTPLQDRDEGEEDDLGDPPDKDGMFIDVNLGDLINQIVISPEAGWEADVMQSVLENQYGLEEKVEESDLNRDPVFG